MRSTCALPYLPPKQEWQLVHCVVALCVAAMGRGRCIDTVLDVEIAGPILMDVFIKGNAGSFFSERAKVPASLRALL